MPKHYSDEKLPSGVILRYYFKGNDYGFPNEYFGTYSQRYPTKPDAIRALETHRALRREREIRESYSSLKWADMEDLSTCPKCFAVISANDVLKHEEWHIAG